MSTGGGDPRGREALLVRRLIASQFPQFADLAGWAVYVGITAAPYHHLTNPAFFALAHQVLDDPLGAP